jgi:hypothetical protein
MIDRNEFLARVYFAIKTNSLSSEMWEEIVCHTMGAEHIPGDKALADGVLHNYCLNIKALQQTPIQRKRTINSDFLSHPNLRQFSRSNVACIQRRTSLPGEMDEHIATPSEIGAATLAGFEAFAQDSHRKFGTNKVLDVIIRHGVNHNNTRYLAEINLSEHSFYNASDLVWDEEVGGSRSKQRGRRVSVRGYLDGKIVAKRISGSATSYQTTYWIYKDLNKSFETVVIEIPLPSTIKYNQQEILAEIAKANK